MSDDDGLRGSGSRKLTPFDRRKLQRALAENEKKRAALAREFGVSTSYVSQFAKTYAREIDDIKRDLADAYAGLWIADKENRVVAYQTEYAMALSSDKANHHMWVAARVNILHAVAEELGQLPPRATVTVQPVIHIIEGINPEALK